MTRFVCLVLASAALIVGCDDGEEETAEAGECLSDIQFFQQNVSLPILEKDCINCHNPQGDARDSNFILAAPGETNYLQTNFREVKELAALERDGVSYILLKPTGSIEHGGAVRFERGSDEWDAFTGLVERFENPVECAGGESSSVLDRVVLLDLTDTLRKAKLQLVGELPTPDEIDRVSAEGAPVFDELLLDYMTRDAFFDTLKRWFNDRLLTDKYLRGESATGLLSDEDFPGRYYYRELPDDTEEGRLAKQHTNDAVARGPLELIAHVVRDDRPFSEVLTADYMMVNPFSAVVYGASVEFDDRLDPTEWRPAKLRGYPHAGVLSSPVFLNRFPTTDTNRNRHRSRMVWDIFLATDILAKADRPVDPTSIRDHNPTMNNPQCAVCHAPLDPLAGAFQNWDAQGRYRPPEMGWFSDMRPPGFGEEMIPADDWPNSLRWVASRIVEDERFALASVIAVYTGLVGRAPVVNPTEDDPRFESKLAYYNLEQEFLRQTTDRFVNANMDLKVVVLEVARSSFYRAYTSLGLEPDEAEALEPMGTARLLTPEELSAKLVATTGYPWKRRVNDRDMLTHRDEFLFFYGGMDSDAVTTRITAPNGIMANIGRRLANEMGCLVTPRDFQRPRPERLLFPHVEASYGPLDENGFEIPEAVGAIKKNIRYLHHRLLGEVLTPEHPEVEATFQLFIEVWEEGRNNVRNGIESQDIPGPCRVVRDFWTDQDLPEEERLFRDPTYSIRAW